jgi:hypothetical protein
MYRESVAAKSKEQRAKRKGKNSRRRVNFYEAGSARYVMLDSRQTTYLELVSRWEESDK